MIFGQINNFNDFFRNIGLEQPSASNNLSTINTNEKNLKFKDQTLEKKIRTNAQAKITNCTLLKGIVANDDVIIRNSFVKHKTVSINNKIYADFSNLHHVIAQQGANLNECSVKKIEVIHGLFEAVNCQLGRVKSKEGCKIQSSLIKTVKAREGKVVWNNNVFPDLCTVPCSKISARDGIFLHQVFANRVMSFKSSIQADGCILDRIRANGEVNLQKTQINSVKAVQSVFIENSSIQRSLTLKVDPFKPCKLVLNNTTIYQDIKIELTEAVKDTTFFQDIPNSGLKAKDVRGGLFGGCQNLNIGNITDCNVMNTRQNFKSFEEIPKYFLNKFSYYQEGEEIKIDHVNCVMKNGKLQLKGASATYLTQDQLYHKIFKILGGSYSVASLEYQGGEFQIINGVIYMIKSPPVVTPAINLNIIGGTIKGQIQFKNCEGNYILEQDAVVENNRENILSPTEIEIKDEKSEDEIPDDYIDCVSFEIMTNPYRTPGYRCDHKKNVIISHVFDYETLRSLSHDASGRFTGTFTCPLTRKVYQLTDCIEAKDLKKQIENWRKRHPDVE